MRDSIFILNLVFTSKKGWSMLNTLIEKWKKFCYLTSESKIFWVFGAECNIFLIDRILSFTYKYQINIKNIQRINFYVIGTNMTIIQIQIWFPKLINRGPNTKIVTCLHLWAQNAHIINCSQTLYISCGRSYVCHW